MFRGVFYFYPEILMEKKYINLVQMLIRKICNCIEKKITVEIIVAV